MHMSASFEEVTESVSRYKRDFVEIERLGKGAFGSVYKSQNKLEVKLYAIKKVHLKSCKSEERIRAQSEIKALANLQHKSIVRYHTCWLEKYDSAAESASQTSSLSATETEEYTEESSENVENEENGSQEKIPVMLYIQMELCEITLKDWMEKRNANCDTEEDFLMEMKKDENLIIFKRILQAVEYIHEKGLIHRDLKPENIFMLENTKIKVGDFGLTTDDILSEDPLSPGKAGVVRENSNRSRHTSYVGTPSYAAPEQIYGSKYTSKSDIYSLGLIIFELYQKFETQMEKSKVWSELRKGTLSREMYACWPSQAAVIQAMISDDPEKRPTAAEILANRTLFLSKDQIIAEYKEKEAVIASDIARLKASEKKAKRMLSSKQKAVKKYRDKSTDYLNQVSNLKVALSMKDDMREDEIRKLNQHWIEAMDAQKSQYDKEIKKLKTALRKKTVQLKKRDRILSDKQIVIEHLCDQMTTQAEALTLGP